MAKVTPIARQALSTIGETWGRSFVPERLLQALVDRGLIEAEVVDGGFRARLTEDGRVARGLRQPMENADG